MRDPRIQLKQPWLAALLAWLIPGAGHFYQGRLFKGTIYSVCILGLFLSGLAMADWSAVQPPDLNRPGANKTLLLKFSAQMGVGLPGLIGLAQSKRFHSDSNVPVTHLDHQIESDFTGVWIAEQYPTHPQISVQEIVRQMEIAHEDVEFSAWPPDLGVPATGHISVKLETLELGGERLQGEFTGTIEGEPTTLKLDRVTLEEPIRASSRRHVFALGRDPDSDKVRGVLIASIARPLLDHVAVPMSPREENQLHTRHGNFLEIWLVFTWIAGLLNMLVIWDAYDGPAYAYGDETPEPGGPGTPPAEAASVPQPPVTATAATS